VLHLLLRGDPPYAVCSALRRSLRRRAALKIFFTELSALSLPRGTPPDIAAISGF
jgi:hypothetical protein